MSKKQYINALNKEIQKLNGLIDYKIVHNGNYREEARRHKRLLTQLRSAQAHKAIMSSFRAMIPVLR